MATMRAALQRLLAFRRIAKPVIAGVAVGTVLWWNYDAQAAPGPLPNISGMVTTTFVIALMAIAGLAMAARPSVRDLGFQWLGAAAVTTVTWIVLRGIAGA